MAESIAKHAEGNGWTLLLLDAGEDRQIILLGAKNDRQQQHNLAQGSKLTPLLLPRTPQTTESTAKRTKHVGWTLLLLAAGEDR